MCEVVVLYDGYSELKSEDEMIANCSCTLIQGCNNIIVDTMTPWDRNKIVSGLKKASLRAEEINYVISTHGHSDHTGNNNLFLNAKHIVGFNVSYKDNYILHPFAKGVEYKICDSVKIVPTPGHTLSDVTVLVVNSSQETVAVTGDLFEKFEDIENSNIWLDAGSENHIQQRKNRAKIAQIADWIVPGHGPKFMVTNAIRESLVQQIVVERRNSIY